MMDLNRRRFLGGAAAFALISPAAAKDEEAYRLRTSNAEIEMTIEFHDGYASQGFWFGEQMSKREYCLSGAGEEGRNCLAGFRGSLAIARYRVRPRSHPAAEMILREHVRTIDHDARLPDRPPYGRSIVLKKGVGSDLQAFGYEAALKDEPTIRPAWSLVSFPPGPVPGAAARSISYLVLETRVGLNSHARPHSGRSDMAGQEMKEWLARRFSWMRHYRADSDLGDELKTHLEMQEEDYAALGISPSEARRRARLRLGSTPAIVENVRDLEFITLLEHAYHDFLFGLRALRKSPVFSLTAILTLGIGIGANTIVFTLLYGLLLRSLPVKDAASLVRIGVASPTSDPSRASSVPYKLLLELRRQQKSFTDISGWTIGAVTMDTGDGAPRMLSAGLAGGNGFEVLGLNAYLGRLLTPADDVRGGSAGGWPAVLDYGFWKDNFGADPSVLGKQIKLSNSTVTIVGIAPPGFRGLWPGSEVKLYLPFQFLSVLIGKDIDAPNWLGWCSTIGRLRPEATARQARAELATYDKPLIHQFIPVELQDRLRVRNGYLRVSSARTGLPTFFGQVYSTPLYLMQGLVGIVLLLCCVNVAGLMMSKVHARRQEFALRTAIGAARWRLVSQYLTESLVIALAGAALGAAAAWYGTGYLLPFFRHPMEGAPISIKPDATVFAVTGLSAVLTTFLFGTLPAWRAGSADPGNLLKSRTAAGARRRILGRAFIPLQVATLVCPGFRRDFALSKPDPATDGTNRVRSRPRHHPDRSLQPPEPNA